MNLLEIAIAVTGAATGAVSLGWHIYNQVWRERPKLKISEIFSYHQPQGNDEEFQVHLKLEGNRGVKKVIKHYCLEVADQTAWWPINYPFHKVDEEASFELAKTVDLRFKVPKIKSKETFDCRLIIYYAPSNSKSKEFKSNMGDMESIQEDITFDNM